MDEQAPTIQRSTLGVRRSTLPKQERMVSRKLIDTLFSGGSLSMAAYPLRVVCMTRQRPVGEEPVQLLVSVPKKRFKHAVDRNRVKRQVREVYRHHKQALRESLPSDRQLLLAFVWLSDRHFPTQEVERRAVSLMQRVAEKVKSEE